MTEASDSIDSVKGQLDVGGFDESRGCGCSRELAHETCRAAILGFELADGIIDARVLRKLNTSDARLMACWIADAIISCPLLKDLSRTTGTRCAYPRAGRPFPTETASPEQML